VLGSMQAGAASCWKQRNPFHVFLHCGRPTPGSHRPAPYDVRPIVMCLQAASGSPSSRQIEPFGRG
jgi:hypothetical protein